MNTTKKTNHSRDINYVSVTKVAGKLLDDMHLIVYDYSKAVVDGRDRDRVLLEDLFLGIRSTYEDVICNMAPNKCKIWEEKEQRVWEYFKSVSDFALSHRS